MNETMQAILDFIVKAWTTELFGPDTVTIGGILLLLFLFAAQKGQRRILMGLLPLGHHTDRQYHLRWLFHP